MSERPTGTVTFLFTDIEGSTRLWKEHPDEMKVALARHDQILREVMEGHGGYVFLTSRGCPAAPEPGCRVKLGLLLADGAL